MADEVGRAWRFAYDQRQRHPHDRRPPGERPRGRTRNYRNRTSKHSQNDLIGGHLVVGQPELRHPQEMVLNYVAEHVLGLPRSY
ncbi:MAG: hypothetical protein QOJ23_1408 [Actinomycetota bacterium]|jgi:hypothetical protein|nr:hypothetical protein [Actinomycetota bacterium]